MALDRLAKVVTPLGDKLVLHSMVGREGLSRPFTYDLVLLSEDTGVKATDLLGQPVTVELEIDDEHTRYFNGVVSRFARGAGAGRYALYRATIKPWLWLLSRTADCRIFQNTTVPDVIKTVFRAFGLTDFDDALSGSYRSWDYIVQYRETSLAFVSRLMEQEGIYYYFKHESGKHTLVLSDGYGAHTTAPHYEEVPYFPLDQHNVRKRDHLSTWSSSEQIQPGAYMLNDFDFTRPKASLQAKAVDPRQHEHASMEYYDYPGEYVDAGDGETYSKARLQALQAQYEQGEGHGNARGMSTGNLFKLTGFPLDDQNREYLITSTHYSIENNPHESESGGEMRVSAEISAIASRVQYRAPQLTPKPMINGPQTAIVVGKAGEEIWTDQYGRVKVQFHWDRLGKSDENSSCWVRVAQIWAGGRWGAMHIPRIGQEVIVEFLEGDPDRPIITGRVYNGDNKPPYDLPPNQTQSGIKSRSTKSGNPDNFNELRFEDKKGEEQVYLQAEKDFQIYVKHDETRKIDHDRFKNVLKNETVSIGVDRTETVGNNETITVSGNRIESVTKNETVTVSMSRSHSIAADDSLSVGGSLTEGVAKSHSLNVGGGRTHSVGGSESVSVEGARSISVGKAQSVSVGSDHSIDVGSNQSVSVGKDESLSVSGNRSVDVSKDETIQIAGGRKQSVGKDDSVDVAKKLVINAGEEIVIKAGDASIVLKKNGDITINGKNLSLTGSGKIAGKADGDVVFKGSKVTQN